MRSTAVEFWRSRIKYPDVWPYERRVLDAAWSAPTLDSARVVLDLGCGDGWFALRAAELDNVEHVHVVDVNCWFLTNDHPKITFTHGDVSDPDLLIPKADTVVTFGLLQYLTDAEVTSLGARLHTTGAFTWLIRTPLTLESKRVEVDRWSDELQGRYASTYRTIDELHILLRRCGWAVRRASSAYPAHLDSTWGHRTYHLEVHPT